MDPIGKITRVNRINHIEHHRVTTQTIDPDRHKYLHDGKVPTLLDEPSEGLAPLVVEALLAKVGELKAQGTTILLAEQGIEFWLALADRVCLLEKGAVRFSGAAVALRSDRSALDQLLAV